MVSARRPSTPSDAPGPDVVDRFIEQWRGQRPDLREPDVMATFGRLGRVFAHALRSIDAVLSRWNLQLGEFDVLATVRRCGPPFTLSPSELTRWLMLSPSGITSRLDRLERLGFIERKATPEDRRKLLVVLTPAGRAIVDEAVTAHVANEARMLAVLDAADRAGLDRALRKLLASFEPSVADAGEASPRRAPRRAPRMRP